MPLLLAPLLILAALASGLAGFGLGEIWRSFSGREALWPLPYLVSTALHAAWIVCAVHRRTTFMKAAAWFISLTVCRVGLRDFGFSSPTLYALAAETMPLAIALAIPTRQPWPARLAQWRRTRTEIATQLRMSQGLVPWCRGAVRQLLTGTADHPAGAVHERFLAELADAECRLRVRLSRAAMPEQLRQSVLAQAQALLADAEIHAARTALELERNALTAAAVCRDVCTQLEGMPLQEQQALAGQCETLLLDLLRKGAAA